MNRLQIHSLPSSRYFRINSNQNSDKYSHSNRTSRILAMAKFIRYSALKWRLLTSVRPAILSWYWSKPKLAICQNIYWNANPAVQINCLLIMYLPAIWSVWSGFLAPNHRENTCNYFINDPVVIWCNCCALHRTESILLWAITWN